MSSASLAGVRRSWWWLVGVGAIGGCSTGDAEDSYHEGVVAVCRGACDGYRRCGLATSGCYQGCFESYDPRGIRGSTLAVVGECLRDEDCATLTSEESLRPCFESAAQVEPLHEASLAYCESASKNYFRCNIWWSVEECTHVMGGWNDAVLGAAQLCHELRCEDIQDCEKTTFENPP